MVNWDLFVVAFMPPAQVLLIASLGAFIASDYCDFFNDDARRSLNKLVYNVFIPCLTLGSLAKSITLDDLRTWCFMPVNIGMVFAFGTVIGWVVVNVTKPEEHLNGVILAVCSAGNLGNMMLMIVPAVCDEEGTPFGDPEKCRLLAESYASFSMAVGGFFIWTHTYSLVKGSGAMFHNRNNVVQEPDSNETSLLINNESQGHHSDDDDDDENGGILEWIRKMIFIRSMRMVIVVARKVRDFLCKIGEELLAPPSLSSILGLIVGAVPWLRSAIFEKDGHLVLFGKSIDLLGEGTLPTVTLILGGNLIKGIRSSNLKVSVIISVVAVRFIMLPLIGIAAVKAASKLNILPLDPLFHYVLMIQFTLPPAMNIGTMTELFDVGQEECSVLFFWTYLVSAIALTLWSTVYMSILV